jgi:uncharacterized protein
LRFVLDTNVVVSALLLDDSASRSAFDRAFEMGKVLLSLPVLAELYEVLGRPRFRKYVSEEDVRLFLAAYVRKAEWVEISDNIRVCRDPKDDKFLELATSGHATHIISGDEDLISLSPFRGIVVAPPDVFLRNFE